MSSMTIVITHRFVDHPQREHDRGGPQVKLSHELAAFF